MKNSQNLRKLGLFLIASALLLGFFGVFISVDFFDTKPIASTPPVDAVYLDATQTIEDRVTDLLSYMTLEEKIGQMALVEKNSIATQSDISTYYLGGLLSGSGAKPEVNTAAGWKEMIAGYQTQARQSRLGIPLLYGVDAIHGHAHVPGMTVFPHAIGLGATHNPELVQAIANATAEDLRYTGVNWSFSPNLDQPQDIRWGRVYEAFSDDPVLVSALGVAYVKGLQGEDAQISVLATPKHFVGFGGMQWGSSFNKDFKIDQGVVLADEETLRATYLPPFAEVVDAGVLSIMVGLNAWGDTKMVLQKNLLTDVLKEELGFKGFLVSDWYGVHEGRKDIFWATVQAVNAGVDMLMLPFDYETFARHMVWANRLGLVSDERIDDAVGRILYAKFSMGLFDGTEDSVLFGDGPLPTHKVLARDAVSQSLVLLKNEKDALPVSWKDQHIRIAGSAADNVGQQMGAWSIEWQGVDGNWLEGGTSILAGIIERAGRGVQVEYNLLGNFDASMKKADVGIAIVGEKPYAEGWGDAEYPSLTTEDIEAIKNLKHNSKRVVVVIVSGRPLLIAHEIDLFDALVSAWLPGSEGGGVADVLFGDKPFTGTLPMPWPSHSEQLPITIDGVTADGTLPLFNRYFSVGE